MRKLNEQELSVVSGGDWELSFDLKVFAGKISGEETIQDIAASVGSAASDAYWAARDATSRFFEMLGSAAYNSPCWNM